MQREKSQRSLVARFFRFIWRLIRAVIYTFFFFVALFIIIVIYQASQADNKPFYDASAKIEGTEDYLHARCWRGLQNGNKYCLKYESEATLNEAFSERRNQLEVPREYWSTDNGYWGYIYQELLQQNNEAVDYIADSLINLAQARELRRSAMADLIVTFVQDIPYVLITNKPCEADYKGPCRSDELYGILSPYEFLYSLEGDCDTRSVLLYALLKRAGFHPMIMVSEEYAHAMIALDVAATGEYVEYQRQKFYFWETTSHGWKPGMLPPDSNNKDYWKIALAHEL